VRVESGLHFQDDFQFDRRAEWQARNTKDKARRDGFFTEDISKQLRRDIGTFGCSVNSGVAATYTPSQTLPLRERQHIECHRVRRFSSRIIAGSGRWTKKLIDCLSPRCSSVSLAMHEEPTTVIIQRYLDALPGDAAAEPIVRELLERAVGRLRLLCATLLYKSYPRLTRPPMNLQTDELLGGVVAGLLTALRTTRPTTVRQFFALANQHMRWQLNDLARRLDQQPAAAALAESGVAAPPASTVSGLSPDGRRMLGAIEGLPEDEREVFDLVGIQGLTHAEAATVVGVSEKTVQRRLNRARLLLAERLADLRPATTGDAMLPPGAPPP
jgi:RNA polymerase sigma-70 factor (ECF subfamily)